MYGWSGALTLGVGVVASVFVWAGPSQADTLGTVRQRGAVACGVSAQMPGFAGIGVNGAWAGLGIDFCRGLAAVIFNDPSKVRIVDVAPDARISSLTNGDVDLLADLLPWTLHNDTEEGVKFIGTLFYDGQGFLAGKAAALKSVRNLANRTVCVEGGSPAEADASEYFDAHNIDARLLPLPSRDAAVAAYKAGACIAYSADLSVLVGVRATLPTPTDQVLLPDLITKEPRGIVVRQGDDRWFDVARWTLYGLLDAEELGVTQGNVDEMLGSDNISIRRLLGVEGDFGAVLGLNKDWAYQLIKGVGNYADIYDRDLGDQSALKLPRGLNALWSKGGIQYSPPVR